MKNQTDTIAKQVIKDDFEQVEHEILPVITSKSGKHDFSVTKSDFFKLCKEHRIRAGFGALGLFSAITAGISIPAGFAYAGILGTSAMLLSGLAWGNIVNKKDFFDLDSKPISFIQSGVGIAVGAALAVFTQSPHIGLSYELGALNLQKFMNIGSFTGGYLIAKGIFDSITGLKWNHVHKEYMEKMKGKRESQRPDIKFDVYYEGRFAHYDYVEPPEVKEARLVAAAAAREKKEKERIETRERIQMLAKELKGQGFNDDLSLNSDKSEFNPNKTLSAFEKPKKKMKEPSEQQVKKVTNKATKQLEIIQKEIADLKDGISKSLFSKEEINERIAKINEMRTGSKTSQKINKL